MYKLGIDVGGTNTDAVLIDENLNVVADIKCPTTGDIYDGILAALRTVLAQSGVDRSQIKQAMLGTTQCTNAIVERKNLAPIGILRIGAPATLGIPPMVDWAEDISKIAVGSAVISGGFEYDGKQLAAFDAEAAKAFFLEMKEKGVKSIAISCVFSTVRNDHELEAAKLCHEVMGEDVYLSQNDGTLMTMEHSRRYPILTVACGPTNSIRGASYLSSLQNAIVIDVGGTTTDLGVIQNGFPRESSVAVTIGGVRTNFRMPDVVSIGLGGGSIVLPEKLAGAAATVKPDHFGCANAIGSAISKVSGTFEKLINYDEIPRDKALEQAKAEAVDLAVAAGAIRETVEIIEVEDVPLAYYAGNTNRVKIKAAGDLAN